MKPTIAKMEVIQSGSERTKGLYKRYHTNEQVEEAANQINEFKDKFIPAYDIILDNPREKEEDLIETLMLLSRLPTSYFLGVFSLFLYSETELYKLAQKYGLVPFYFRRFMYVDRRFDKT